jgi:hypothetical protein
MAGRVALLERNDKTKNKKMKKDKNGRKKRGGREEEGKKLHSSSPGKTPRNSGNPHEGGENFLNLERIHSFSLKKELM